MATTAGKKQKKLEFQNKLSSSDEVCMNEYLRLIDILTFILLSIC